MAQGHPVARELDAFDIRILALLQRDASLSTAALAEQIGVSVSPCWRRVRRLRAEGYIKSTVALVDRRKIGCGPKIFAQVKTSGLTDDSRAELLRRIEAIPEILECYTVAGESDFMLKLIVPDALWYQEFLIRVLSRLPGIKDVRSIFTLAEAKYTTALPLKVPSCALSE